MAAELRFEIRADTASGSANDDATVQATWVADGTTDLGRYTTLKASAAGDSPWREVAISLDGIYRPSLINRLELNKASGNDSAHIRNVRVVTAGVADYGEFPRGWPYTADVADGVVAGVALINDGGSLASASVARQGVAPYEYWDDFERPDGALGVMPSGQTWQIVVGSYTIVGGAAHGTAYTNAAVSDFHSTYGQWTAVIKNLSGSGDVGVIFRAGATGLDFLYWQLNRFGGGSWYVKLVQSTGVGDIVLTQNFVGNDSDFVGSTRTMKAVVKPDGSFEGYLDGTLRATAALGAGDPAKTYAGVRTSTNDTGSMFDSVTGTLGASPVSSQYAMDVLAVVPQTPATWYFGVAVIPPLRMLQRDDGLGGSSPRQAGPNGPTSRQSSIRQGLNNTYV